MSQDRAIQGTGQQELFRTKDSESYLGQGSEIYSGHETVKAYSGHRAVRAVQDTGQ